MKYMGSKRGMLKNGLGEALDVATQDASRVLDLFTGSAAVAHHSAERYRIPVLAADLQGFAVALANAVLCRVSADDAAWFEAWQTRAFDVARDTSIYADALALQQELPRLTPKEAAERATEIAAAAPGRSLCAAYGGYYYSPLQALWLDAFRQTMPDADGTKAIALAALISAGSSCAAAPGHTAQPFKPNDSAGPYLLEAWLRNVPSLAAMAAANIGARYSKRRGQAFQSDALEAANRIEPGDLVFLDPPYSSVHYSRFYHVLEAISEGYIDSVTGNGRYPSREKRPSSDFSVVRKAPGAFDRLLHKVAERGGRALVTFPAGQASNGLSGDDVREIAERYFTVVQAKVTSRFSTLGGDTKSRAARQDAQELILTLTPRS